MKKCNACGKQKPLSEFYKNKITKDGHHGECKPCNKTRATKWYKNNLNRNKNTRLNKSYGISLEQYLQMLEKQENKCAICDIKLTKDRHTCVDHCHSTNKIRGILCTNCNILLGQAKDSIKILKSAQKYLNKYTKFLAKTSV
jgi:hypothetical protein